MSEATKFEVGAEVQHAALGKGLVLRNIGGDRAYVKFVGSSAEGDREDVVLSEDLKLVPSKSESVSPRSGENTLGDRSEISLRYKIPGIPLGVRSKAPVGIGATEATLDPQRISQHVQTHHKDSNWGLVAQAREGGVWILDCDSPDVAKLFKKETGQSMPKTLTVQSSQGGHRYFRQNAASLARLKNFSVSTPEGKEFFSVRWDNQYTVGPLSVHPSGDIYRIVCDRQPAEAPEFLLDWLLGQNKKETPKRKVLAEPTGGTIPLGLRDSVLTSIAGKQRQAGANEEEIYASLGRINLERCSPPLGDDQVRKIARSIGAKSDGTTLPSALTIDGKEPGTPAARGGNAPGSTVSRPAEEVRALQALVDSTPDSSTEDPGVADSCYPYWVWRGTLYQEFADFCGRGNLIPKEMFIESVKTIVGAICGHRFVPQEARFYTFLLTKIGGVGKGTAVAAAQELFFGTGLVHDLNGSPAFTNLGCARGCFASSAGLYTNGFSRHNRIFQCYDELTKLLEKFSIPGSGDAFLDDLNTLFEATGYAPALTKSSKIGDVVSGSKHNSILGGTTFDKWNSAFSKTTAEGSGFFQRLNLISSEETATVPEIARLNFSEGEGLVLREKFLAKIAPLEFQEVVFEKTPEAERLFSDWHKKFQIENAGEPAETTGRLNVLATRNYEHLAWMLAPDVRPAPEKAAERIRIICDVPTMEKAIALSEYQFQSRSKHRPAQGNNDAAMIEDSIRLTLHSSPEKGMGRRDLYRKSGAKKYGLFLFNKVLGLLQEEGLLEVGTKTNSTTRGRKGQVVVWVGEGE